MDKTDPSGGHSAIDTAKQGTAVLSISQFARICKDTTDANYKTGKSADTTSEKDLALLLAHGDAGGVVSIAIVLHKSVSHWHICFATTSFVTYFTRF